METIKCRVVLLPTDKPSRLAGSEYITNEQGIDKRVFKFKLWDKLIPSKDLKDIGYIPQNIYILSNEQIKLGDWVYNEEREPSVTQCIGKGSLRGWKKIILATDQDLIKDGVQAIDDTFLEWFINNPSCEEVEVKLQHQYQTSKEYYIDASYVDCSKEQYDSIKSEIPTCPLRVLYKILIPNPQDELWGNVFAKIKQYGLNNEVLEILKQNFNISKR
jgi:hypothetical protein